MLLAVPRRARLRREVVRGLYLALRDGLHPPALLDAALARLLPATGDLHLLSPATATFARLPVARADEMPPHAPTLLLRAVLAALALQRNGAAACAPRAFATAQLPTPGAPLA